MFGNLWCVVICKLCCVVILVVLQSLLCCSVAIFGLTIMFVVLRNVSIFVKMIGVLQCLLFTQRLSLHHFENMEFKKEFSAQI